MPDSVQIGLGRSARRGYHLADVALVPSRRTRDVDSVSTAWQIDAYRFEIPLLAQPSDAIMSPAAAVALGKYGGLGVLNAEGLWTRYEDPGDAYARIADIEAEDDGTPLLQELYAEPVKPELVRARIAEIRAGGVPVAVRISPQHTLRLAPVVLDAGVDILVIQGTIVSAEHVASGDEPPLNLKTFIADLDVPVIVGGCVNYQTALHLMRTGAAGVIVGTGSNLYASTRDVLGIDVPMATAIADAAAARRDYLDETGGRYVHVVASGEIESSGDIAKALAVGADAVMLGDPLAPADTSPGGGAWWDAVASHPKLPRGDVTPGLMDLQPLEKVLFGPSDSPHGGLNLFGALRRAMAKSGYSDLKELQKVGLIVTR